MRKTKIQMGSVIPYVGGMATIAGNYFIKKNYQMLIQYSGYYLLLNYLFYILWGIVLVQYCYKIGDMDKKPACIFTGVNLVVSCSIVVIPYFDIKMYEIVHCIQNIALAFVGIDIYVLLQNFRGEGN